MWPAQGEMDCEAIGTVIRQDVAGRGIRKRDQKSKVRS